MFDSRVFAIGQEAIRLRTLRDRMASDLSTTQAEVSDLSVKVEKLTKVSELFRTLMDLLVMGQVQSIESIVTEGLQSIFPDLNLSMESDVGIKYNKVSVEFAFRRGAKENPLSHRGNPLDAFGGGPAAVASFVLRTLSVLRLKRFPFLLLDESLGGVSTGYEEDTSKFLKTLTNNLGVDLLLVTHKPGLAEHSDQSFVCSEVTNPDSTTQLSIRSVK